MVSIEKNSDFLNLTAFGTKQSTHFKLMAKYAQLSPISDNNALRLTVSLRGKKICKIS